jgi:hypothetical protein
MLILLFHRVVQNVADFLFHTAPGLRSQACFHIVFQIAHDELGPTPGNLTSAIRYQLVADQHRRTHVTCSTGSAYKWLGHCIKAPYPTKPPVTGFG